jgi:hypothetical protein
MPTKGQVYLPPRRERRALPTPHDLADFAYVAAFICSVLFLVAIAVP